VEYIVGQANFQKPGEGEPMKNKVIYLMLVLIIGTIACGTTATEITPPYDITSPETVIAWCPSDICPNSRVHLNTVYFTNDTPLTFDDNLLVYHGAYCKILEKRTVDEYIWTDEFLEQTKLSAVEVWLVECNNRYRRGNDGATEYLEGSYSTQGWTFPNSIMITVSEWDKEYMTP
jgi:hypothetical protein